MKQKYLLAAGVFVTNLGVAEVAPPFEITEPEATRPRCKHYNPNRKPFFGETHLHTGLSFDASLRYVNTRPEGAYKFAKKEGYLVLPDANGRQTVKVVIDRPLDWGAVTDHAEFFGEMGICKDFLPNTPDALRYSLECQLLNGFPWQFKALPDNDAQYKASGLGFQILVAPNLGPSSFNTHLPLCNNNKGECETSELAVWDEMRSAAEAAYDRSDECKFTSFPAYEVTSTPLGTTWHRNVIFRNDKVVRAPITAIDMAVKENPDPRTVPPKYIVMNPDTGSGVPPKPEKLWKGLEDACIQGLDLAPGGTATRCDALTIPHNTNIGGGVKAPDGTVIIPPSFYPPANKNLAKLRAQWEPLVEMYQVKGSSECRYDPRFKAGVQTADEFCNFELLDVLGAPSAGLNADTAPRPKDFSTNAFVRNVWKDGLLLADNYEGINPFKMGVVSGSDAHTGVLGWHPENQTWPGHAGFDDAIPTRSGSAMENGTGGYTVAWAEENSRDAIFSALKRKETYGTSGTRPVVRFFGGWNFPADLCSQNFVRYGYANGVPMGGDLPAKPSSANGPKFIVAAWMDEFINTPLQQIQIIKGWVDPVTRQAKEKVVHIAGIDGDPNAAAAGVDQRCQSIVPGYQTLCKVWQDRDFDPGQRAFYYARVLENPVCRWTTRMCKVNYGLNPMDADQCNNTLKRLQTSSDPAEQQKARDGAACCHNETSEFDIIQPVIQERAWTSPIWYTPASL